MIFFEDLALNAPGAFRVFFTAREYDINGQPVEIRGKGIAGTSLVVHVSDKEYSEDPCEIVFQKFQSSSNYHHSRFAYSSVVETVNSSASDSIDNAIGTECLSDYGSACTSVNTAERDDSIKSSYWEDEDNSKIVYIPRNLIFPLLSCSTVSTTMRGGGAKIRGSGWVL